MTRVAIVGAATQLSAIGDGRTDAELLGPVVDEALTAAGVTRADVGVLCSASSEFLNGVVGSMMDVYDVLPCWPPLTQSHLEGDGGFAVYEAWARLLAGEAEVALVCAYGRPLGTDPTQVLSQQFDPYVVAPLGLGHAQVAALQARAVLDAGRYREQDFAAIASARRSGLTVDEALASPYVAAPLRAADCSTPCAGAAAVVLATESIAARQTARPAWIAGIEQRVESGALGGRDLTRSVSTEVAAARLRLPGTRIDVLEVHAPFSHQELLIVDAIGASEIGELCPSGGVLAGDALTVSGLGSIAAAASAVLRGAAQRAVGHATNGPCLQHNLLCLLESAR